MLDSKAAREAGNLVVAEVGRSTAVDTRFRWARCIKAEGCLAVVVAYYLKLVRVAVVEFGV